MSKDPRFAETVFVVEATHAEQHFLWCEWHGRLEWEQDCHGLCPTIGTFGDMPVVVCCSWSRINGRLVLFYEAVSQIVDHRLVEAWIWGRVGNLKWDHGHRRAHCDAMNFHLCVNAIKEMNEAERSET